MTFQQISNKWKKQEIEVSICEWDNKRPVYISGIEIPPHMREKGLGTKIMTDLCKLADHTHQKLSVFPSSAYGCKIRRLRKFYMKFGFKRITNSQTLKKHYYQWDYRDKDSILHTGITDSIEKAEKQAAQFGYTRQSR